MKKYFAKILLLVAPALVGGQAFASEGGPGVEFINYYAIVLSALGVKEQNVETWVPVLGGIFVFFLLLIVGLLFNKSIEKAGDQIAPEERFSLRTSVEILLDFIMNLARDVIGEEQSKKHFTLLCGLFLFIFTCNITGLVPGFPPATESINTNLAMGLTVFFVYNYAGIREHGRHYIKQFLGPVWWIAPLLVVIELLSHLVRPVSLSLRLLGNLFGDHLVLSVFTGLTYLVLPAFLLFFGLLVAVLQSFVFTLLSSIYISLAISHDH